MSAIIDTIEQFENIEIIAQLNGQEIETIEHFLEKSISKNEDLKKEAKKRYNRTYYEKNKQSYIDYQKDYKKKKRQENKVLKAIALLSNSKIKISF
jgi:hypothetical protein